jgi:hypothetical protein
MNAIKEIIESIDVIVKENLKKVTSIYYCVIKEKLNNNKCKVFLNNKEYTVPFYGGTVQVNKVYPIILPFNSMNNAFVIGENIDYNTFYPVGSVYYSTSNVNPSTFFSGVWQQIETRVLTDLVIYGWKRTQ